MDLQQDHEALTDRDRQDRWKLAKQARKRRDAKGLLTLLDPEFPESFVIWVLRTLGEIQDPASVLPLISFLEREKRSAVRNAAATTLGALGDVRAIPSLAWELASTDKVYFGAIDALASIGGEDAVDALKLGLDSTDSRVRARAAEALGVAGGPDATAVLAGLTSDPDFFVRSRALNGLYRIGSPEAETALTTVLPEMRSRRARWWLKRRLRKMRSRRRPGT